jgi:hyperosmotically inducible periplasmic protein
VKLTNLAMVAACVLVVAGCNQSSDRGSSGQNSSAETGRRLGAPPAQTTAPTDTNAAASRSMDQNVAKPPDNTARNVRDRSDSTLTPSDQGQSKADVDLLSRVRRAITSNDQLSTTAKNIKVIETNGTVTLRGPVNSAAEKEQVVKAVQGVQGVTSVDDQLEVKANQ